MLWIVPERQKQSLIESIQGELDGAAQAVAIRVVAALELEQLNLLSDINEYLGQASGISVVAIYLGDRSSEAPFAVFPSFTRSALLMTWSAGRLFFSEVDFASEGASGVVLAGYEKRAFEARLRDINIPLYVVFGALLVTQLMLFLRSVVGSFGLFRKRSRRPSISGQRKNQRMILRWIKLVQRVHKMSYNN